MDKESGVIRQHHRYAETNEVPGNGEVDNPFKMGFDHGKPARGTMLDSQRGASRGGKISHGSTGYDD